MLFVPAACDFPHRALCIAPHHRGPHRENDSYLPPYAVHSEINQLKTIKTWGGVAITTAILIVISANFFDSPIALFSYQAFGHLMIVRQFAATPGFFGPLEVFVLLIFLARRIALSPLERPDLVLILCEASLLLTNVLVLPLKFIFGRTWPLYGHPSLLIDGAYSFFTAGQCAFPSGHMASIGALACILWRTYPRFKPLFAVGVTAIATALVAGDFHFVSDVLAGGFIGVTVGAVILAASDFVKMRLLYVATALPDGFQAAEGVRSR
jgi:membrane-associated phospholipid phosphatase